MPDAAPERAIAWQRARRLTLGEAAPPDPPDRVQVLIDEHQVKSEILIGWVQFALVAFFVLLYTFSAKTSAGTKFLPVPWVLAAFLLFTALRLLLAYRRRLTPPLLVLGVCFDIALLMVLIWSFHLQYEQTAPFYLKAPTLLYVFIFIALRSLRFEPLYVAVTGVAGALGWLALVLIAVMDRDVITRDYVQYMTSNSVLIGAEVDKIISILMVTLVLALGLHRARRILYRAVSESVLARDLRRFVSPEVAARLTSAERELQPGDGEVRTATVLFTDIEGFSAIAAKLSPHDLVSILNDYFAALSGPIERYGGAITQYEGDAMLITFNTLKDDAQHAAHAVHTALAIQEATHDRTFGAGIRLRTRCGINTGEIVAGAVGTRDRLLYTVHGDEVNLAARLEELNKTYRTYVLVSEATARAAGGDFTFERIGEITVRGGARPTIVYSPSLGAADSSPR